MSEASERRVQQVQAVSRVLYDIDPDGRGSSVFAPDDEYDDAAARIVSSAAAARGNATGVADAVRAEFPDAAPSLGDAIAATLAGPETEQAGGAGATTARTRAVDLFVEIQQLFARTGTTDYLRQIDGIQGLLADPGLADDEALSRAAGAFLRMKEQMATSRDEFYVRHADRELRVQYNAWFADAMRRLEELLTSGPAPGSASSGR